VEGEWQYGRRRTDEPDVVPVDLNRIPRKPGRFDYALANSFEAIIAIAAMLSGAGFFFDPDALARSAIGQKLDNPVDDLWSAMYLLSGICILFGLLFHGKQWRIPRDGAISGVSLEIAGLVFLATAGAANALAVVIVSGWSATIVTYSAVVFGSIVRARALWIVPSAVVPVEVPGGGNE